MQTVKFLPAIVCTFFLLFMIALPGVSEMQKQASGATNRVAAASSKFGLKLFARLNQAQQGENIFVSPGSIAWCLGMALNGAQSVTKDEMLATLEMNGMSLSEINQAYRDWKNSWGSIDPKVEIDVANSIWSRRGVGIRPAFIDLNKNFFGSEVAELNFNDPATLTTINSWVKNKTRGKIEKIVDQISPDSVLFLINAIYFNGKWTREFEEKATKVEQFKTGRGAQKDIRMMHQRGTYLYQEQPEFQAISLPYGNKRLSMYIFLPSESSNLAQLHRTLSAEKWSQWMTQFREEEGEIGLPRFRVEYEATLNDALQAIGMRAAFDPGQADFGAMTAEKVFISSVKHKAFAEVTEEGTEAAAATSTEFRIVSMPVPRKQFRMIVNRPFLFAIRDNSSGVLLFLGSISEPK